MKKHLCAAPECTGCLACLHVCPKHAIGVTEGFLGEILPTIDEDKCVDCGLCDKICPSLNPSPMHLPMDCYAAWTKNEVDYVSATSGGMATAISKSVISKGGVVYGCAAHGLQVKHMRCATMKDVEKLKGSKYVQSEMGDLYQALKKDVLEGLTVLFIGTPCQVAGVKNYLRQEYDNLLTVDLICHGVPSQQSLHASLRHAIRDIEPTKVTYLSFRNHAKGDFCLECRGFKKDGKPFIFERGIDYSNSYYPAFFFGNSYRNSCYQCRYAYRQRISDISIGDFWGLKDEKVHREADNGISVVLVNTDKGTAFYALMQADVHSHRQPVEDAIAGNAQLNAPTRRTGRTRCFRFLARYCSFEAAFRITWMDRILKSKMKYCIKKIIRK